MNDISNGVKDFKSLKKPSYIINLVFLVVGSFLLYGSPRLSDENKKLIKENKELKVKIKTFDRKLNLILKNNKTH